MSDPQTYAKQLEKLIANTLLPVYKQYCVQNNLDIYSMGIPPQLFVALEASTKLPALLLPKQTGC